MKLITELRQINDDYETGTIEITNGLTFSQYNTLRTTEFYSNSQFLNGNKDRRGREKPFYNIINTMVDTAVVATDIDTKDVRVTADNETSQDKSFLFNHEIQRWMKESDFARVLNEMGETRARYGGVIVKKTKEKGEDMEVGVVDWKNIVTDQVDIMRGVIIEKHYMTPQELREKSEVWENVEDAIDMYSKKGYTRTDERIEIWEAHGMFPVEYLEDEHDVASPEEYSQQVHFYAVKNAKVAHLYWAEEKEMPYKYLPWKKMSGRALGRGVVEEGNESQVWTNDAVQKENAYMEWASKVFLKTNSKKIGQNASTDHENGDIFTLEEGKDINVINMTTGVQPQFQVLVDKWWSQYERVTSSYDAVRGETPPSGQPYRLQALVSQSGSSHFDYRREEWGIFLKELFYDWVFPYIQAKLTKQHILASDFTPEELKNIDESFATHEANKYAMDKLFSGQVVTAEDYNAAVDQYTDFIAQDGKRRFIDVPDNYFKDMKAKLTIDVTGEQKNKQATLESLSNILQTVQMSFDPNTGTYGVLQDPTMSSVFNKILELSGAGLSPMSLTKTGTQTQAPQQQAQGAQPVAPSGLGQEEIKSNLPQAVQ